VSQFLAPKKSLGNLDVEAAAKLITAAADVALVVDAHGVIRDLAFSNEELAKEGGSTWLGQPWTETVTVESRPKIEALLRDAGSANGSTWRHVNHPSPRGPDVPVLYSAIKLGKTGRVIAVGRNLRPVAVLQQRLVEVQQSLERDYARLRNAETRYRLLFQMAAEAIVIVDASSDKVLEANPAALKLLDSTAKRLAGKPFSDFFDAGSVRGLGTLLNRVRTAGHADEARLRLRAGKKAVVLAVSLFQQDKDAQFIARLSPVQAAGEGELLRSGPSAALRALAASPDGFIVTDNDGRLLSANRSFLDVVQCAAEEQVRGKSLSQWLGRPGADLGVLLANLRQHGSVRLFATTLRGELGLSTEVEISAVAVPDAEAPVLGFVIRSVGRRLPPAASERELPRSPEQLTELIGRVPLKDIVRETTDVIERLCIEAALQLTGDNRASAAEMLGLSRQSLYLKLHRYGLGELEGGGP
jgi:transcriptional regulator PpsR